MLQYLGRLFPKKRQRYTPRPALKETMIHPWDANMPILDLTGQGDYLTMGDMFTDIAVLGATGSGKTSALATIAQILMELHCGFVFLCVKPDEVRHARRIAEEAGRTQDVIVIGEDVDGRITPHRFNPLDYELSISTTGTRAVVEYLSGCTKVLSRKEGQKSSDGNSRFWDDQFERLILHCIDTGKLAGRPLSVALLREIQLSAPANAEELGSDQWAENSTCWQCILEAERRMEQGLVPDFDFQRILNFWTKDYMRLDTEPRSTIDVMFAVLCDAFYAEEPVRSILSGASSVTPDDVMNRGVILIVSLPTSVYYGAGRMAQHCVKTSFQRAMLRRRKPQDGSLMRPCVLWLDEAHALCHPSDSEYFREVRSNRGINVYLEQGIGGYMEAMNYHNPAQVDNYLQNLGTKFFFQNNSEASNKFAADCIGTFLFDKDTASINHSLGTTSIGDSTTQEQRHRIISGEFGLLQRGGIENDRIVTGFVLRPVLYRSTGTNVAKCNFQQTNLTR